MYSCVRIEPSKEVGIFVLVLGQSRIPGWGHHKQCDPRTWGKMPYDGIPTFLLPRKHPFKQIRFTIFLLFESHQSFFEILLFLSHWSKLWVKLMFQFFFVPAKGEKSTTKFESCFVPNWSFGISFCLPYGRNSMGISRKFPVLAFRRLRSNQISNG